MHKIIMHYNLIYITLNFNNVEEVRHLGVKLLKDKRIERLNYVDTEFLESLKPDELLLTTNNIIANEAISPQTNNMHTSDWGS